jgi:hypothetical protein
MSTPPRFVDAFLALPLPLLAAIVLLTWALVGIVVHRALVPRIAGSDGRKIGKFEAEVASQLGIVLGLLLSFNAVTVWEQSGAARDATLAEASALREIRELAPDLPAEQQPAVERALHDYLRYLIDDEWPKLGTDVLGLDKPPSLRALARLARTSSVEDFHDAVAAAIKARDDRIRVATSRMLPARWGIVIFLSVLALLAIGLVHAEHPRARAVAIGMVAFAIAACFLVLILQGRPFLGKLALRPAEISALAEDLERGGG